MGSFQASVSAAWAVDASSRPASNSITCRVRTEFSLFPDVDRHGSATGRPPDGPEVMPAPRVWPRDHRSPKLSRPPSPAAHDRTAPSRPAPVRILLPTAARRLRAARRPRPSPPQGPHPQRQLAPPAARQTGQKSCRRLGSGRATIDHRNCPARHRQPPMTALRLPALLLSAFSCPLLLAASATAAEPVLPQLKAYTVNESWRQPVEPRQVAEHTWRIGTEGIHALLVKTDAGAVLIDGGMPQAADMLLAQMRELGVEPGDLKLIMHSQAHGDHVGPLAAVRRATGATLWSQAESALLLGGGGETGSEW